KILRDILYGVSIKQVSGDTGIEVKNICFDSRKAEAGSLFVAVRGTQADGHQYVASVIEKGAIAVVCEELPEILQKNVCYVQVEDSAKALGILASNYFENPSVKLNLIGITGTNGKTTTATLLFQ